MFQFELLGDKSGGSLDEGREIVSWSWVSTFSTVLPQVPPWEVSSLGGLPSISGSWLHYLQLF